MQFSVGDLAQRDELRMYAMMAKEKKAEKTKTLRTHERIRIFRFGSNRNMLDEMVIRHTTWLEIQGLPH